MLSHLYFYLLPIDVFRDGMLENSNNNKKGMKNYNLINERMGR